MSPSEEWEKLCEEHAAARDAHFKALAAVNQRFLAGNNPNDDESDEFETTWVAWEDIKRRMSSFIKGHA